jgi:hypothetical protein
MIRLRRQKEEPLGRLRLKDIIKMNIKQIKIEDVNWIKLAQNMAS